MAYVSRTFQRRRGATGPDGQPDRMERHVPRVRQLRLPHEHGHISVVLIRPTADAEFGVLRHLDAFEAACRAIPGWPTGPTRRSPPRPAACSSGAACSTPTVRSWTDPAWWPSATPSPPPPPPPAGGSPWPACRSARCSSCWTRGRIPPRSPSPSAPGATPGCGRGSRTTWPSTPKSVRRWQGHDLDLGQPLTSAAIVAAAQVDAASSRRWRPSSPWPPCPPPSPTPSRWRAPSTRPAGANRPPTAPRATSCCARPTGAGPGGMSAWSGRPLTLRCRFAPPPTTTPTHYLPVVAVEQLGLQRGEEALRDGRCPGRGRRCPSTRAGRLRRSR